LCLAGRRCGRHAMMDGDIVRAPFEAAGGGPFGNAREAPMFDMVYTLSPSMIVWARVWEDTGRFSMASIRQSNAVTPIVSMG
jgi:hypothetical protein